MGQQNLAKRVSAVGDTAHGPDLISRLAVLDDGLALDAGPGIMIERADHRPHVIGRMIEHGAVIGFCHRSKPALSSRGAPSRYIVASRTALRPPASCDPIAAQSQARKMG